VTVSPQYEYVWPFSEGKGRVLRGERDEYVDRGARKIHIGKRHGYVNRDGKIVIPAKFEAAWEFSKGLARVRIEGKEGYINHEGDYVWEPTR
jgi:hypothetical protein